MTTDEKLSKNRDSVQWKIHDIINQLNDIESLVNEYPLSTPDENFLSHINSIKMNIEFYFSNWPRGTNQNLKL